MPYSGSYIIGAIGCGMYIGSSMYTERRRSPISKKFKLQLCVSYLPIEQLPTNLKLNQYVPT